MNGFFLGGRNIKVGRPHNAAGILGTSAAAIQPAIPASLPQLNAANRIYVGSIHWDLTPDDLKTVFQAFGPIRTCVLMPNPETGKHKGYGFIEFENGQSAEDAIGQMNGWELGGRQIKVGRAVSSSPMPSEIPLGASTTTQPVTLPQDKNVNIVLPPGFPTGIAKKPEESLSLEENITISNPNQRYEIMQKLARGPTTTTPKPSRCVVLRNMVDAENVDEDLEGEVAEECSKFGVVEKVVIFQEKIPDAPKPVVKIFVLFNNSQESQKAISLLDGRFFGGRQITAQLFDDQKFLSEQYAD
eukprot:TRINITY_DN1058_c0_g1_i1.p1 TRINITY_DN1058_c0_g1~~TRINITY_DN1058_c0_g1_i1.p1  ORF type:complete len:300 (-),score=91.91 TRINITY_DN1058_c0_g1_i1:33-932(-)